MNQAQTVADTLADHDIAAVFASPLQRAQETATPIAGAHGLEIITNDGLIEADNQFEGLKVSMDLPNHIGGLYHTGSVGIIMSGWLGTINYGVITADKVDKGIHP